MKKTTTKSKPTHRPVKSVTLKLPDVIDIHTHILPPDMPKWKDRFGYGGFGMLKHHDCGGSLVIDDGKFIRDVDANLWEPSARIKDLKRFRVSHQVLSTVPFMFSYWAKAKDGLTMSKYLNDHMASIVSRDPQHFSGLGTLPMQDPDLAAKELGRCMTELGMRGVQIGSHINKWNLDAPELYPFWAEAERLDAAIFVHPWDMVGQEKMPKYWLPWLVGMPAEQALAIGTLIFGGVFEKFKKLRICFAHGGGAFPMTLGRFEQGFKARPDLCAIDNPHPPRKYLNRIFVDSLVHDADALKFVINLFGADQVALGSDYPFPLGETMPGKLIRSLKGISAFDRQMLLSGTAARWLNWKAKK